jgi:PAS domain S-box-containing protein
MESSLNGIYVYDLEDQSNVYINPQYTELTGHTLESLHALEDEEFLQLFHPDELDAIFAHMEEIRQAKDNEIFEIEYRFKTTGGEWRWCLSRDAVFLRNAKGKVRQFIGTFMDITERKRTEEALKEYSERLETMVDERTQELKDAQEELIRQEKLATLGQLSGSVAHELRHPLGVLSNAAYYLIMTLSDADEITREYLEIISEEVRKAQGIITNLLDFARTKTAEPEETTISTIVSQVVEKHDPPEGVQVITEISADLPPIFVDPIQIELVLDNLVINAYQAMSDGGQLIINAQTDQDNVRLSVQDTGTGISPENMAKLFEPLFTTKARGIGLGLALSKKLVEANGGTIEVESKTEQGSTFIINLPTVR